MNPNKSSATMMQPYTRVCQICRKDSFGVELSGSRSPCANPIRPDKGSRSTFSPLLRQREGRSVDIPDIANHLDSTLLTTQACGTAEGRQSDPVLVWSVYGEAFQLTGLAHLSRNTNYTSQLSFSLRLQATFAPATRWRGTGLGSLSANRQLSGMVA